MRSTRVYLVFWWPPCALLHRSVKRTEINPSVVRSDAIVTDFIFISLGHHVLQFTGVYERTEIKPSVIRPDAIDTSFISLLWATMCFYVQRAVHKNSDEKPSVIRSGAIVTGFISFLLAIMCFCHVKQTLELTTLYRKASQIRSPTVISLYFDCCAIRLRYQSPTHSFFAGSGKSRRQTLASSNHKSVLSPKREKLQKQRAYSSQMSHMSCERL